MPPSPQEPSWEKQLAFFLLSFPGVGRRTVCAYIDKYKKNGIRPEDIREHVSSLPPYFNALKSVHSTFKKDEIELYFYSTREALERRTISVLYIQDGEYPEQLRTTEDPPLFLFCRGNLGLLASDCVGVVGTRKATAYGQYVTRKVVTELAQENVTIISGAMYGIDETAHRQALECTAKTIAVLGYGHDQVYPKRMARLLDQIVSENGLVLSEYPPEVEPLPAYFVARNRIIAGMSRAVVVTEAAQKSGSHSTALFAATASRQVFAVPGPISNPYSEGTKWLVNQGATLVSSGYEVVEYLGGRSPVSVSDGSVQGESLGESLEDRILALVQAGPASVELLAKETGRSLSEVLSALSKLELDRKLVKDGILWYLRQT